MAILDNESARAFLDVDADEHLVPFLRPMVERAVEQCVGWEIEQATYTRYYPKSERGGGNVPYFPGTFGGQPQVGGQTYCIFLDHKFVRTTSLQVWEKSGAYFGQAETFDDDSELTIGTHFVLDMDGSSTVSESGCLRRLSAYWPTAVGSVKVTYKAGFSATELKGSASTWDASDLRYATLLTLQQAYNQLKTHQKDADTGKRGLITAETIEGYSYQLDPGVAATLQGMQVEVPPAARRILDKYRRYSIAM